MGVRAHRFALSLFYMESFSYCWCTHKHRLEEVAVEKHPASLLGRQAGRISFTTCLSSYKDLWLRHIVYRAGYRVSVKLTPILSSKKQHKNKINLFHFSYQFYSGKREKLTQLMPNTTVSIVPLSQANRLKWVFSIAVHQSYEMHKCIGIVKVHLSICPTTDRIQKLDLKY